MFSHVDPSSRIQNLDHLTHTYNVLEDKHYFEHFKNKIESKVSILWSRIISKISKSNDMIHIRKIPRENSAQRHQSGLNGVWYDF